MTYRQRKALIISGWVFLSLFLVVGVAGVFAYLKRESLLKTALDRAVRKAKRDYSLDVQIGSARFTGLNSVAFTNVSVVPQNCDTLTRLGRVEVGVRFWPLLTGKIALSGMTLENGLVQLVKRDTLTNIDFLIRHPPRDSLRSARPPAETNRRNLSNVAENVIENILSKIPDDLNIHNLEFRGVDNGDTIRLLTQTASIKNEAVSSTLKLNGNEATWHLAGTADPANREYNLALYADGQRGQPKPLELPYIQKKFNLKLQADTLRAELRDVDRAGPEFRLEGAGSVSNLRINHPAVARTDVLIPQASMQANLFVGENYVGIDSSSTLRLGQISARPFVKYSLATTDTDDPAKQAGKTYELQLHTDQLDAQSLFNSFPQGLFESLAGMTVAGKLKYDLAFKLDTSLPDSVRFNSSLAQNGFRILKMGQTDFSAINQPFVYTPYEKGKPVRPIMVGPKNPDYTPLNQISPDLRNALLTSEDYNFFTHAGFNEKAFRMSIATNFKEKSFKRGASTVSMQLVKNAFLSRNKTISRKIEEILIVWLIENEHIVSKERMYEVYLNIIEWGRNIYGIGEAARYYFAKSPADLNLGESIFLAFVVPSPKAALSWFVPDGTLQVRNVRGYFKLIGRIMARRGLTTPDSGAYGFYDVRLREGLRRQVAPVDTLFQTDSLLTEPPEGDIDEDGNGNGFGNFFRRLFKGKNSEDNKTSGDQPATQPDKRNTTRPDATTGESAPADTVKTRRQLRQERREQKRREQEEQLLREKGGS